MKLFLFGHANGGGHFALVSGAVCVSGVERGSDGLGSKLLRGDAFLVRHVDLLQGHVELLDDVIVFGKVGTLHVGPGEGDEHGQDNLEQQTEPIRGLTPGHERHVIHLIGRLGQSRPEDSPDHTEDKIGGNGGPHGQVHVPIPGLDLLGQSHVDGQDHAAVDVEAEDKEPQRLAVLGHDVVQIGAVGHEEDDGTHPDAADHPEDENAKSEEGAVLAVSIELRILQHRLARDIAVGDGEDDDGDTAEDDVVESVGPLFVERLAGELIEDGEPKLGHHQKHVLVKEVHNEFGDPTIAVASVDQQQRHQKPKLSDGKVGGVDRL